MPMMRLISVASLLAGLSATPALADVGHLLDAGHGHSHWGDYAILAGIAAVAAGWWLARLARRRSTRQS